MKYLYNGVANAFLMHPRYRYRSNEDELGVGRKETNDLQAQAGDFTYDEIGNLINDAIVLTQTQYVKYQANYQNLYGMQPEDYTSYLASNRLINEKQYLILYPTKTSADYYNYITDKVSLTWRLDGKVKSISTLYNYISFIYDANGTRVAKKSSNPGSVNAEYYLTDANGQTMANYKSTKANTSSSTDFFLTERPIYGSSRLGINSQKIKVRNASNPNLEISFTKPSQYSYTTGSKAYELSNHLGNVMVVTSDIKEGIVMPTNLARASYYKAIVLSATDYYPFGYQIENRTYASESYKYGFNGMEKDNEIKGSGNFYDFGLRCYDPRLGRMLSIDPRAPGYPWQTTYAYHRNSPISILDYLGGGDNDETTPPPPKPIDEVDADGNKTYSGTAEPIIITIKRQTYASLIDLGPKPVEMDYKPSSGGVTYGSESTNSPFSIPDFEGTSSEHQAGSLWSSGMGLAGVLYGDGFRGTSDYPESDHETWAFNSGIGIAGGLATCNVLIKLGLGLQVATTTYNAANGNEVVAKFVDTYGTKPVTNTTTATAVQKEVTYKFVTTPVAKFSDTIVRLKFQSNDYNTAKWFYQNSDTIDNTHIKFSKW